MDNTFESELVKAIKAMPRRRYYDGEVVETVEFGAILDLIRRHESARQDRAEVTDEEIARALIKQCFNPKDAGTVIRLLRAAGFTITRDRPAPAHSPEWLAEMGQRFFANPPKDESDSDE